MLEIKPPIGIKPRKLHDKDRAVELLRAMFRYIDVDKPVPTEWIIELEDLTTGY